MNRAKARDFFSDYYEGTLDRGLTLMFERALKEDSLLKEDYASFCDLMGSLDEFKDVEVPEPAFLHERIETRINQKLSEKKTPAPLWWLGWGKWAFAGAAGVAVLALLFTLTSQPNGQQSTAGVLPDVQFTRELPPRLSVGKEGLILTFRPKTESKVTIATEGSKEAPYVMDIEGDQLLKSPIKNESSEAKLVDITFSSSHDSLLVALPGSSPSDLKQGTGTVKDLALALAGVFGKPVQVAAANLSQRIVWDFREAAEPDSVSSGLRQHGLSLEERANGILFLN